MLRRLRPRSDPSFHSYFHDWMPFYSINHASHRIISHRIRLLIDLTDLEPVPRDLSRLFLFIPIHRNPLSVANPIGLTGSRIAMSHGFMVLFIKLLLLFLLKNMPPLWINLELTYQIQGPTRSRDLLHPPLHGTQDHLPKQNPSSSDDLSPISWPPR